MLMKTLQDKDIRSLMLAPAKNVGTFKMVKGIMSAIANGRGQSGGVPRHILPSIWRQLGSRKAVVTHDGFCTYEEYAARVTKLANSFHQQGINEGDRVATLLRNEQAWFDVMGAAMASGIKMPMLNIHLKPHELVQCVNACAPKALVFSEQYLEIVESIRSEIVSVQYFVVAGKGKYGEGFIALEDWIQQGQDELPPGGFGVAQMPFSGGSTGVPKFIVDGDTKPKDNPLMKGVNKETLNDLKFKFARGFARLGLGSIKGPIVSMIPGPLYHSGVQTAVFPIFMGATIVPMYKFDAEDFLAQIEKEKVNWVFVAPTMLERVLKLPKEVKAKYNLSSMQVVLCAAAPCPARVKQEINQLFKAQGAKGDVFNEYYGSSEASIITVLRAEDYEHHPHRYKSVGKVCGSDCRIYNMEKGEWAKPNEEGHVLVRNSRIYNVNYGNSDEMKKSFLDIDGAYWYDDGCIGYLDEDEFLYLTSRSKEMIISGGVNIFPVEIEEVIKSHDDVIDAAVIKMPDPDLGEVPAAVIQLKPSLSMTDADLTAYCKENGLYGFKLPKQIKFVEELPRNTAGKIRKVDLEKEFTAETA